MNDRDRVELFLTKKNGYLKWGAKKINETLSTNLHINDINKIKKVVRSKINGEDRLKKAMENYKKIEIKISKKKKFNTKGTHLLMGCNHIPFHDKKLHDAIINLIKDIGPKLVGFHILGDFMDINTLSSHDRGKFTAVKGLTLKEEYRLGNIELDRFEKVLPKTVVDKSFIYGNHENRVQRFNGDMQNAKNPAILVEDALRLLERGYSVFDNWQEDFATIGNGLDIFHGIYYNVHCAKAHLDKFKRSCVFVHTHRSQMYREGDLAAYNIGACADFDSRAFSYGTRGMKSQWCNGFAISDVDEYGNTFLTQIDVKNSTFYYNGKKY